MKQALMVKRSPRFESSARETEERKKEMAHFYSEDVCRAPPRRNANLSCTLCGREKKLFPGARFEKSGVCEWSLHNALRSATRRFCQPQTLIIITEMINQLNKHEQSNNSNQRARKGIPTNLRQILPRTSKPPI